MASVIDICNTALSHLGDPANIASIDPPEGSPQARYCARYYPIARDEILESHSWAFNVRRAVMTSVPLPEAVEGEWQYAYSLPNSCLRPTHVYLPGVTEQGDTEDYAIEADSSGAQILYTNVSPAYLKFRVRVTDPARFSPAFVTALTYLLARYVSGPLTKDMGRVEAMDKLYLIAASKATALDSQSQSSEAWRDGRTPDWVAGR